MLFQGAFGEGESVVISRSVLVSGVSSESLPEDMLVGHGEYVIQSSELPTRDAL